MVTRGAIPGDVQPEEHLDSTALELGSRALHGPKPTASSKTTWKPRLPGTHFLPGHWDGFFWAVLDKITEGQKQVICDYCFDNINKIPLTKMLTINLEGSLLMLFNKHDAFC